MFEFNPADPFPHLPLEPSSYPAAKRHAAMADRWLGIEVEKVEAKIRDPGDGQQRWLDRHPSIFLTPYVELRAWLEQLRPEAGSAVVDLGAGYGRLGFVLARHFPECRFLGFELVPERVKEAAKALERFGAGRASMLQADISDPSWKPPVAEIYFIYDYGTREAISKTLGDLRELARGHGIQVVGRGRAVRDCVEKDHPWLGAVHPPLHEAHYSLYRSFA